MSPKEAIDNLRFKLQLRGLDEMTIDAMVNEAASRIASEIASVVHSAYSNLADISRKAGVYSFIDDLAPTNSGGSLMFETRSGKTDFSTPEVRMLPHFLKNAKLSEDNLKYQVIPINKQAEKPDEPNKAMPIEDSFQAADRLNQEYKRAADAAKLRRAQKKGIGQLDPLELAIEMVKDIQADKPVIAKDPSKDNNIQFRAASEKQDPNEHWITPPRDRDFGPAIMNANSEIEEHVSRIIDEVMRSYGY